MTGVRGPLLFWQGLPHIIFNMKIRPEARRAPERAFGQEVDCEIKIRFTV